MRLIYFFLLSLFLIACKEQGQESATSAASCKGVQYGRSSVTGELTKSEEFFSASLNSCVTKPLELTNYEKTADERQRKNITCVPQGLNVVLKASANFYAPRNDRQFIELKPNGEYRSLVIGEYNDGRSVVEKQVGCYRIRTDVETEPLNPRNYGSMIMFEFQNSASSKLSSFNQIFNYTDTGAGFELVDPSPSYRADWNFENCPYLSVLHPYCSLLKTYGNIMYYPSLTAQQQADLLAEAILIRSTYSFTKTPPSEFIAKWDQYKNAGTPDSTAANIDEWYTSNWNYRISFETDPNPYTSDAHIEYMKNLRPYMPDLGSPSLAPVCYDGWRVVTLSDGSQGNVYGEICYEGGTYTFTQ